MIFGTIIDMINPLAYTGIKMLLLRLLATLKPLNIHMALQTESVKMAIIIEMKMIS